MERRYGTPSVDPATLASWQEDGDVVVLDARPHAEYLHHHLPGALDTGGGAEVVFRGLTAAGACPRIVVNCAGRTRGIIGAQTLRDTGVAAEVFTLHHGTPAWTTAGLPVEHGPGTPAVAPAEVPEALRAWATRTLDEAGVTLLDEVALAIWTADAGRTTHVLDVRHPDDVAMSPVPGGRTVQGGQLVQACDDHLAVRRARGGAGRLRRPRPRRRHRAVAAVPPRRTAGRDCPPAGSAVPAVDVPVPPDVPEVGASTLGHELRGDDPPLVLDLRSSAAYLTGHVPGSALARREDLPAALEGGAQVVLVGGRGALPEARDLQAPADRDHDPRWTARDLAEDGVPVRVLVGDPAEVGPGPTAAAPRVLGDVVDHVGPPAPGPARHAWYRDYFAWNTPCSPTPPATPTSTPTSMRSPHDDDDHRCHPDRPNRLHHRSARLAGGLRRPRRRGEGARDHRPRAAGRGPRDG